MRIEMAVYTSIAGYIGSCFGTRGESIDTAAVASQKIVYFEVCCSPALLPALHSAACWAYRIGASCLYTPAPGRALEVIVFPNGCGGDASHLRDNLLPNPSNLNILPRITSEARI